MSALALHINALRYLASATSRSNYPLCRAALRGADAQDTSTDRFAVNRHERCMNERRDRERQIETKRQREREKGGEKEGESD